MASNLAIIYAKLGDRQQAQAQLERAEGILPYFHGRRLEFFVAYARGTVSSLLGNARGAIEAFEEALPVGRELGDHHMVRYGEVYLAEAHLACGEYRIALRLLRQTAAEARNTTVPLLTRMVHCRLWLLEALLGRSRSASLSRRMVENTPRTDVELLEAWNDLLVGLCQLLSGETHTSNIENGRSVFERLGVPYGSRFAHLLLAVAALLTGDRKKVLDRHGPPRHHPRTRLGDEQFYRSVATRRSTRAGPQRNLAAAGHTLASATPEGAEITLWDTETWNRTVCTIEAFSLGSNLAFSPDGSLLAFGSSRDDSRVVVWEVASRKIRKNLRGHQGRVVSVAWSPDGRVLASGSTDTTVTLWTSMIRAKASMIQAYSP